MVDKSMEFIVVGKLESAPELKVKHNYITLNLKYTFDRSTRQKVS